LDPLDGDDAVCIPETPALGTIANIALNVKESTPSGKDAIRGMLKGGGMYNDFDINSTTLSSLAPANASSAVPCRVVCITLLGASC